MPKGTIIDSEMGIRTRHFAQHGAVDTMHSDFTLRPDARPTDYNLSDFGIYGSPYDRQVWNDLLWNTKSIDLSIDLEYDHPSAADVITINDTRSAIHLGGEWNIADTLGSLTENEEPGVYERQWLSWAHDDSVSGERPGWFYTYNKSETSGGDTLSLIVQVELWLIRLGGGVPAWAPYAAGGVTDSSIWPYFEVEITGQLNTDPIDLLRPFNPATDSTGDLEDRGSEITLFGATKHFLVSEGDPSRFTTIDIDATIDARWGGWGPS